MKAWLVTWGKGPRQHKTQTKQEAANDNQGNKNRSVRRGACKQHSIVDHNPEGSLQVLGQTIAQLSGLARAARGRGKGQSKGEGKAGQEAELARPV